MRLHRIGSAAAVWAALALLPGLSQARAEGLRNEIVIPAEAVCPEIVGLAIVGQVFGCWCGEDQFHGAVWGSGPYTADSGLCQAARHAGAVGGEGGPILVQLVPGLEHYAAGEAHGVTSSAFEAFPLGIAFIALPAGRPTDAAGGGLFGLIPPQRGDGQATAMPVRPEDGNAAAAAADQPLELPVEVAAPLPPEVMAADAAAEAFRVPGTPDCPVNAMDLRQTGAAITCFCLPSALLAGDVWGTFTYSDDSPICRAALHAGAVIPEGGMVSFQIAGPQQAFEASTRNGITSQPFGPWEGSYTFIP